MGCTMQAALGVGKMKLSDIIPIFQMCQCYWHKQIKITRKRQKTIRIRCRGKTHAVVYMAHDHGAEYMCKRHFDRFQRDPYPHSRMEVLEP